MTEFSNRQISPPKDWDTFEDLCADLWTKILNDPDVTRHGRNGQRQHGVDVYGQENSNGSYVGIQCKGKNGNYGVQVTEKELRNEAIKAEKFSPRLSKFILVSTAPHDAPIQAVARQLSTDYEEKGLFKVVYFGWDEIHRKLSNHPDLIDKHYPEQGPSTVRLRESIDQSRSENHSFHSSQSSQLEALSNQVTLLLQRTEDSDYDEFLTPELDRIRSILDTKPKTAHESLETIKKTHWRQLSNVSKFRILTNMGACKFRLGEESSAATYFEQAYDFQPDDEKAKTNLALASLLRDDISKARQLAEMVLKDHPENTGAASVVIATTSNDTDPTTVVPAEMLEKMEVAFALAALYRKYGDFDSAVHWSKKAFELSPDSLECAISYATNTLQTTLRDTSIAVGNQPSEEEQETIKVASSILTDVWNKLKVREARLEIYKVANNLLVSLRLLNQYDQAEKIITQASALGITDFSIDYQHACILINKLQADKAIEKIKPWVEEYKDEAGLLYAEILMNTGKHQEALSYLSEWHPKPLQVCDAMILHLQLTLECSDYPLQKYIDDLDNEIPINGYWLSTIIRHSNKAINQEKAYQIINQYFDATLSTANDDEILMLAHAAYDVEHYYAATKAYECIHATHSDSKITRDLLICYHSIDARKQALELLEKLLPETLSKPFFLRIMADFHLRAGNIEQATELLGKHVRRQPNDLSITIQWLILLMSNNSVEEISQFLRNVQDYPNANQVERLDLAQILRDNSFTQKALEIAYDARRRGDSDPNVHLRYIGVLLGINTESSIQQPKIVETNCGVTFEEAGNTKQVFIEAENYPTDHQTIIPQDALHAQALLGKKQGETSEIIINQYSLPRKITIKEIVNKYTYFFRETMTSYETRFPEQGGLMMIETPQNEQGEIDITPLIRMLESQSTREERFFDGYCEYPISIGMLSQFAGKHPFQMWEVLATKKDLSIDTCQNTLNDRQQAIDLITNNDTGYILDPLVIFHHYYTDTINTLFKLCPNLGITQSTLSLIDSLILELQPHPSAQERSTISSYDGGLVRHEHSLDQVEKNINSLKELSKSLRKHCSILPAVGSGQISKEANEFAKHMDGAFVDCMLVAQQSGRLLLSDDARLRGLAKQFWDVDGIWSQILLIQGKLENKISQNEYFSVIKYYILFELDFTTFDCFDLECAAEDAEYNPGVLRHMLKLLGKPNTDINSVLLVVIHFLALIWNSEKEVRKKKRLTYLTLSGLTRDYCHQYSEEVIQFLVKRNFYITPFDREDFIRTITEWLHGHFIPSHFK